MEFDSDDDDDAKLNASASGSTSAARDWTSAGGRAWTRTPTLCYYIPMLVNDCNNHVLFPAGVRYKIASDILSEPLSHLSN